MELFGKLVGNGRNYIYKTARHSISISSYKTKDHINRFDIEDSISLNINFVSTLER
jgi:hypothetical protein